MRLICWELHQSANKQPACCRVDSRSTSTSRRSLFLFFKSLPTQKTAVGGQRQGRRASLEWTLEFERHKLTSVIDHSVLISLSCQQAALRRDEAALRSRCRHCRRTKIKNNSVSEKKTEPLRGQSNVKSKGRDAKRETQTEHSLHSLWFGCGYYRRVQFPSSSPS